MKTMDCCTPSAPCRRCQIWSETSAHVPRHELRPCVLCEELWADLAPRTGLCPACRVEILEAVEEDPPEPECDVRELARRVEEKRRAELEEARQRWQRMEAAGWRVGAGGDRDV